MKKFYTTLALAAAVAISASAANPDLKKLQARGEHFDIQTEMLKPAAAGMRKVSPAPAKAKPATAEEACGYYEYIDAASLIKEQGTYISGTLSFYKGEGANDLIVKGIESDEIIKATFDPATATISIPSFQDAFFSDYYNEMAYFIHLKASTTDGENWTFADSKEPLVLTFNDQGEIEPFADGYRIGLKDSGSWYAVALFNNITRLKDPSNEGWYDCGQATFTDGFYSAAIHSFWFTAINNLPSLTMPAFDIKLQRSTEDPNLFRLLNPYASFNDTYNQVIGATKPDEMDYLNLSKIGGAIVFNTYDPECVLLYPNVYSGLEDDLFGLGLMQMYNSAGYDVTIDTEDNEGMTFEERIQAYKDFMGADIPMSSLDKDLGVITVRDAQFSSSELPVHTWDELAVMLSEPTLQTVKTDMTSVIILPDMSAIDNINVDNSNKVIEYFNLQGIRVENPSNGIYIRRQGNDVQKVYVR